jgi:acetoin utilization deacetylase AcuC-like enzyme
MLDADTFTSPDTAELAKLAAGAAIMAVGRLPVGEDVDGSRRRRVRVCAGAAAGASRRVATGHGLLLLQQRRRRRRIPVPTGSHAWRSSTSTCTAATVKEIFCSDPSVLFISTHQYPFYPGTGAAREIGAGRARASR